MSKYDYRDFLDNKYYCANVRIREAEVNDILPNPNDVKILYESFLKAKAFDIIKEYMVRDNQHINIMADIFSDEDNFNLIKQALEVEE